MRARRSTASGATTRPAIVVTLALVAALLATGAPTTSDHGNH